MGSWKYRQTDAEKLRRESEYWYDLAMMERVYSAELRKMMLKLARHLEITAADMNDDDDQQWQEWPAVPQ